MSVQVTDKRGQGKRKAPAVPAVAEDVTPPSWWTELGAVDQALAFVGEQHHSFDNLGNAFYKNWAKHYEGINSARIANDRPTRWDNLILEAVFKTLSETDPERLYGALTSAAATLLAMAQDLRSQQ